MHTIQLRRCVFWGLVFSFVLFGMIGCQTIPSRPRGISASRYHTPEAALQQKSSERLRKSAETKKERSRRHPSRYRRKLRAKYA
ncbi:MAG: hypothetical protein ACE5EC_08540 [Phycisphaerae bacterium]